MRVPPKFMAPRGPSSPTLISCSLCKKWRRAFRKKNSIETKPSFTCFYWLAKKESFCKLLVPVCHFTTVIVRWPTRSGQASPKNYKSHDTDFGLLIPTYFFCVWAWSVAYLSFPILSNIFTTLTQMSQHTEKTQTSISFPFTPWLETHFIHTKAKTALTCKVSSTQKIQHAHYIIRCVYSLHCNDGQKDQRRGLWSGLRVKHDKLKLNTDRVIRHTHK